MLKNDLIFNKYTPAARVVLVALVIYSFAGAIYLCELARTYVGITGMVGLMMLNLAVFLPYVFEHQRIGEVT